MVVGISAPAFAPQHAAASPLGIFSAVAVGVAVIGTRRHDARAAQPAVTTALTSTGGLDFPSDRRLPCHAIGGVARVVLATFVVLGSVAMKPFHAESKAPGRARFEPARR